MKLFCTIIIQFLLFTTLSGQYYFDVEGKQIKTGSIRKEFKFTYIFNDSFTISLEDSVVQYSNAQKNIVKTIKFTDPDPWIEIEYFGLNGRDSIKKIFQGDTHYTTYSSKYDSIGRIVYFGVKDFHSTNINDDNSYEMIYEYYDSMIHSGRMETQTVFIIEKGGDKYFDHMVLTEYDNENKIIKTVRKEKTNDPWAETQIYTYDKNDSLISIKSSGLELLSTDKKTKCNRVTKYSFVSVDYHHVLQLTKKILIKNKKQLTTDYCAIYFRSYISKDRKTELILSKGPAWGGNSQEATFKTIHTYDNR